jgi:hypothetical protein
MTITWGTVNINLPKQYTYLTSRGEKSANTLTTKGNFSSRQKNKSVNIITNDKTTIPKITYKPKIAYIQTKPIIKKVKPPIKEVKPPIIEEVKPPKNKLKFVFENLDGTQVTGEAYDKLINKIFKKIKT